MYIFGRSVNPSIYILDSIPLGLIKSDMSLCYFSMSLSALSFVFQQAHFLSLFKSFRTNDI